MFKLAKLKDVEDYTYDVKLVKITTVSKEGREERDCLEFSVDYTQDKKEFGLVFTIDVSTKELKELLEMKSLYLKGNHGGTYGEVYFNNNMDTVDINKIIISRYLNTKYVISIYFQMYIDDSIFSGELELDFKLD